MNVLLAVLVVAGLLFGGGATVNAAQDDLPNEPLYAVKMWSEDVSLQLKNDPEEKVNRLMELAQVRVQEMTKLVEEGQTPPDQVRLRLEQHVQQALQTCSNMDEAALDQSLLQVRDRLQQQDRDVERLQLHTQDQLQLQIQNHQQLQLQDQQQLLTRTRTMLRERLQLVEDGLLNHEMFRNAVRNGFRHGQEDDLTPAAQNGNGAQYGQPTSMPGGLNVTPGGTSASPGGPNATPGGPNTDPGGTSIGPGGPNTDSGGPNTDPGGPNTDPGGNMNGSGSGSGGNNNDAGGNGYGGNDGSGSGGSGGNGSGGNNNSGGGGTGGSGHGGNRP